MEIIGWEIQPLGWVLLVIVGILLIHWLQRNSRKNSDHI